MCRNSFVLKSILLLTAVEESGSDPAWKAKAFYRDYYVSRDNLEIIGQ